MARSHRPERDLPRVGCLRAAALRGDLRVAAALRVARALFIGLATTLWPLSQALGLNSVGALGAATVGAPPIPFRTLFFATALAFVLPTALWAFVASGVIEWAEEQPRSGWLALARVLILSAMGWKRRRASLSPR